MDNKSLVAAWRGTVWHQPTSQNTLAFPQDELSSITIIRWRYANLPLQRLFLKLRTIKSTSSDLSEIYIIICIFLSKPIHLEDLTINLICFWRLLYVSLFNFFLYQSAYVDQRVATPALEALISC